MWSTALRLSWCLSRTISLYRPVLRPVLHPAAERLCVSRGYSDGSNQEQGIETLVVGVPQPFTWLRAKISFFLIRKLLDPDFNYEEFGKGASHAISFVSRQLSECKFDALEDVVAKEVLTDLKERCSALSNNYRKALEVGLDDIKCLTPRNIHLHDDNGRKFVTIFMYFWYVKNMYLMAEEKTKKPLYQIVYGNYDITEAHRVFIATYGFTREFTQGVEPNWIITHVKHSTLLE